MTRIKLWMGCVAVGFCLVSPAQAVPVTIADSLAEFSGTQGQDNWYYGYRTDDDGFLGAGWGAFSLLSTFNAVPPRWQRSGTFGPPYLNLTATNSHPDSAATSLSGSYEFSSRRWVSEVTGLITVTGMVQKVVTGAGDGFVLGIFTNGFQAVRVAGFDFTGALDGGPHATTGGSAGAGFSYVTNLMVVAGDHIEFIHASFSDIDSDSARYTSFILADDSLVIPEPTALTLLATGALLLAVRRRR